MLPFKNPRGKRLKSYDILRWSIGRGPFILREVVGEFKKSLSEKLGRDGLSLAEKDASERIRKLVKSGMVMVITPDLLESLTTSYTRKVWKTNPGDGKRKEAEVVVEPMLTKNEAVTYAAKAKALAEGSGRGRRPRVYLATRKGREYVEYRSGRAESPERADEEEENE